MEENSFLNNEDRPTTTVKTEEKIETRVKVVIFIAVIGAIAAGIIIALLIN